LSDKTRYESIKVLNQALMERLGEVTGELKKAKEEVEALSAANERYRLTSVEGLDEAVKARLEALRGVMAELKKRQLPIDDSCGLKEEIETMREWVNTLNDLRAENLELMVENDALKRQHERMDKSIDELLAENQELLKPTPEEKKAMDPRVPLGPDPLPQ
jgi:chromosome segregation ATPase